MTATDDLYRDAEVQIEAWLCELDATWHDLLDRAEGDAARIVAGGRAEAAQLVRVARTEAQRVVADARATSDTLLAAAGSEAQRRLAQAEDEFERLRMIASEHADGLRALAAADAAAARGAVREDMTGIREAVDRLRLELSRVVDAAFDALPAVEATAGAIDRVMGTDAPVAESPAEEILEPVAAEPPSSPPRSRLRRLLRLGR